MRLTDTAIRNAKTTERPIKLFDGNGLFSTSPSPAIIGGISSIVTGEY